MQEILMEKDQIIKELEKAANLKEQLVWRDPVYYISSEKSEDGPYCPQCYDSNKKLIRLQTHDRDHWQCLTCDKNFYGNNYKPGGYSADSSFEPYDV
jgi:transposase-like protein